MEKNDDKKRTIVSSVAHELGKIPADKGFYGDVRVEITIKVCDGFIQKDWEVINSVRSKRVFN